MKYTIRKFEKLDSSNSYAKMYHLAYDDKTVIWAAEQKNGYGRFNRTWESDKDLTFSIIFKNNIKNNCVIAPLVISNILNKLGINTEIKWPNDIVIDGKKICGILIESIYEGKRKVCDVVGVGINFSSKATRVSVRDYKIIKDKELLDLILFEYDRLLEKDKKYLIEKYRANSAVFNYKVKYKEIMYHVDSISDEGHLILEHNGYKITVTSDEITLTDYYKKENNRL